MGKFKITLQKLILASGVLVLLTPPRIISSDGYSRWQGLKAMFFGGAQESTRFSIAGPIFSLPLLYLDEVFGLSRPWFALHFNLLLFFVLLVFMCLVLAKLWNQESARIFAIIMIFASMYPFHTLDFYGEIFTSAALAIGGFYLVTRRHLLATVFLALGIANTPAATPAAVLLLFVHAWSLRRLKYVFIIVPGVVIVFAENFIRRGSWLNFGYSDYTVEKTFMPYSGLSGFSYPLILGLLSELFSFGKGLLFFVPGFFINLFFPVKFKDPKLNQLLRYWLVISWGLIFTYAKWWAWYGGGYWGPRFLLFCSLPASLMVANVLTEAKNISWKGSLFIVYVLLFSFWGCVESLTFGHAGLGYCYKDSYQFEAICWYIPEFSALFRPFIEMPKIQPKTGIYLAIWCLVFIYTLYYWISGYRHHRVSDVLRPHQKT